MAGGHAARRHTATATIAAPPAGAGATATTASTATIAACHTSRAPAAPLFTVQRTPDPNGNHPPLPVPSKRAGPKFHAGHARRPGGSNMRTRALAVVAFLALAASSASWPGAADTADAGRRLVRNAGTVPGAAGGRTRGAPRSAPGRARSRRRQTHPEASKNSGPPRSRASALGHQGRHVSLRVKRGGFQPALAAATATAGRFGGSSSPPVWGPVRLRARYGFPRPRSSRRSPR